MKFISSLYILPLLGSLTLLACTPSAPNSNVQVLTHDSAIQSLNAEQTEAFHAAQGRLVPEDDCALRTQKILCASKLQEMEFDPQCSYEDVPAGAAAKLWAMVERLPEVYKKTFCRLNRIQIQEDIYSIAYAASLRSTNRQKLGNMIGIRSDLFDPQQIEHLYTWKEQLNFGLSNQKDPLRKANSLGQSIAAWPTDQNTFALATLVHELTHVLDFMNPTFDFDFDACRAWPINKKYRVCDLTPDSFERISWGNEFFYLESTNKAVQADPQATVSAEPEPAINEFWRREYPLVAGLCFYYCEGTTLPPAKMDEVYAELRTTDFLSPYSAMSPQEDFAEAAAWLTLSQLKPGTGFRISGPQGQLLFDSQTQLNSAKSEAKRKWVEKYLSNPELVLQVPPQKPTP